MADESDEDPQLKSLRAVWLEMRDEDPPSRGLDALMAAARTQAAEMTPAPWWKRAFAQLRRPPMLAFASLALLIGGAVVLTRHDDAIEKAQPTIAPTRETETPTTNKDIMAPLGNVAPAAPVTRVPEKPVDPQIKADTRSLAPKPPTHHVAPGGSRPAASERNGEAASFAPPPPPPPPPKTEAQDDKAMVEETGGIKAGAQAPQPAPTRAPAEVLAEQLATQMRTAAARGDCDNAKAIAARIARQDPAYYKERVAAEIAKCGAAPKAADQAH